MSNNDTNYSKYTTNLCDIEQHDKEECQYIENEDNHFEPSEIMVSDKCMPIIMSASLGDNTNEHRLNRIVWMSLKQVDTKIVLKMMVRPVVV